MRYTGRVVVTKRILAIDDAGSAASSPETLRSRVNYLACKVGIYSDVHGNQAAVRAIPRRCIELSAQSQVGVLRHANDLETVPCDVKGWASLHIRLMQHGANQKTVMLPLAKPAAPATARRGVKAVRPIPL